MTLQKSKITTLGLIPELTCKRSCTYCYEKRKDYGDPLSIADFKNAAEHILTEFTDIEEILFDYNGGEGILREVLLYLTSWEDKKILVTGSPRDCRAVLAFPNARFSLSIHDDEDLQYLVDHRKEYGDRVECVSIMFHEVGKLCAFLKPDVPIYFNIDKFSTDWPPGEDVSRKIVVMTRLAGGVENIIVDNCLATILNKQECPAWTQINLYGDGSVRYCPYSPTDQLDMDTGEFSEGCYLSRSIVEEKGQHDGVSPGRHAGGSV